MTTPARRFSCALERAFLELPSGTARSRLTHYCGRLWDLLRSYEVVDDPRPAAGPPVALEDEVGSPLVLCLEAIAALVAEGFDRGEFASVPPRGAARLLVSSLIARARWCRQGVDPVLRGSCSRAVVETLDLIWPALTMSKENR